MAEAFEGDIVVWPPRLRIRDINSCPTLEKDLPTLALVITVLLFVYLHVYSLLRRCFR